MKLLFDSFWRALLYCFMPRVMLLSALPLALLVLLSWLLAYFYWQSAVEAVRQALDAYTELAFVWAWLQRLGAQRLQSVMAPLLVVLVATPLLVLSALLVAALFMTPALAALVAKRRFAQLTRLRGGSLAAGLLWTLGSVLAALLMLVVSLPLWLVPPLALLLPPLIWGWLTYRVMVYDVLAAHASVNERRTLMLRHRLPLLLMGVASGYLGLLPSLVWASGALFVAAFVLLVPLAIWAYTWVFAFSSLWFAHYALAALEQLRATPPVAVLSQPNLATEVLLPPGENS